MNSYIHFESPFQTLISFHKVIESLEVIAQSDVDYRSNYAKALLNEVSSKPEFRDGIKDFGFVQENAALIQNLLADLFPTALTHNEIKAATIPFQNIIFNYSERFKAILREAGHTFDMTIRDFDHHQFYVMNCTLILNGFYKKQLDFSQPLFYDIPDANGIIRHYRILYNGDFIEIYPTPQAPILTEEDIVELRDNFDDLDLWKEKFPPGSYVMKGFVIASLIDVTVENAVSNLKTFLLSPEINNSASAADASTIFKSVFKIPDLRTGFTIYNAEEDAFQKPAFNDGKFTSFILFDRGDSNCKSTLCDFYNKLISDQKVVILSDVRKFLSENENNNFASHLLKQDIQSCILAPVINNGQLMGILELASSVPGALHSINATKLDLIMPFLLNTIVRLLNDMQNKLEAVIQKEYTTIHPSVYWKFKQEARNYVQNTDSSQEYLLKEIVFKNVYPLYGQIDIKGSSQFRNETVKTDIRNQLLTLLRLFESVKTDLNLAIFEQRTFELQGKLQEIDMPIRTDTEQQIQRFIEVEIHPMLQTVNDKEESAEITAYFDRLDAKTGMFYHARKDFDQTLTVLNKKLAEILDEKQIEAQRIYPHYYERFKTDGVEHNLYIGEAIVPTIPYDKMYLNNLRLWQLQTLCEMENEHYRIKDTLPYALDVTSLILVFSSPISIRFRMDEKRFDVDGSYNARYEVVKKRIDKAHIKGTGKRITQEEKITIVYSHNHEEVEYLNYIKYLQFKEILEPEIEKFDIEDLQGISGLRALRVKVARTVKSVKKLSYQQLIDELN